MVNAERQVAIQTLRATLRNEIGVFPSQKQIRALVKLFSEDYTSRGIGVKNWRLNREINIHWLNHLNAKLGRLPTRTEAKGLLFATLTQDNQQSLQQAQQAYPRLVQYLALYQKEYSGDDIRRIFENAIEHQLLLNCRDACPKLLGRRSSLSN